MFNQFMHVWWFKQFFYNSFLLVSHSYFSATAWRQAASMPYMYLSLTTNCLAAATTSWCPCPWTNSSNTGVISLTNWWIRSWFCCIIASKSTALAKLSIRSLVSSTSVRNKGSDTWSSSETGHPCNCNYRKRFSNVEFNRGGINEQCRWHDEGDLSACDRPYWSMKIERQRTVSGGEGYPIPIGMRVALRHHWSRSWTSYRDGISVEGQGIFDAAEPFEFETWVSYIIHNNKKTIGKNKERADWTYPTKTLKKSRLRTGWIVRQAGAEQTTSSGFKPWLHFQQVKESVGRCWGAWGAWGWVEEWWRVLEERKR